MNVRIVINIYRIMSKSDSDDDEGFVANHIRID
jgi:hypothetical protein